MVKCIFTTEATAQQRQQNRMAAFSVHSRQRKDMRRTFFRSEGHCYPKTVILLSLKLLEIKTAREWSCQGQIFSKPGNVSFHCHVQCVLKGNNLFFKSRYCRWCSVPLEIETLLTITHRQYLKNHLGI